MPPLGLLRRSRRRGRTRLRRPARPGPSPAGARAARRISVPRPTSRRTSSSHDGGARKTNWASGQASATWRAPCRSISSSAGRPSASAASTGVARGAVAVHAVHHRPLQQRVRRRPARRTRPRRRTGSARRPSRRAAAVGWWPRPRRRSPGGRPRAGRRRCPCPTAVGSGQDGEAGTGSRRGGRRRTGRGELGDQGGASGACPRPRSRRLAAMSSRSITLRGSDRADPRQGLQHVDHLGVGDHVVVLGQFEHVGQACAPRNAGPA